MKPKGLGMAGMLDGCADAPLPNVAGAVQRVLQVWVVAGVGRGVCAAARRGVVVSAGCRGPVWRVFCCQGAPPLRWGAVLTDRCGGGAVSVGVGWGGPVGGDVVVPGACVGG